MCIEGGYSTCGLVKPRTSFTFPEGLILPPVSFPRFLSLTVFRRSSFKESYLTFFACISQGHKMGEKKLEEGQDVVGGMACPGYFPLEINI